MRLGGALIWVAVLAIAAVATSQDAGSELALVTSASAANARAGSPTSPFVLVIGDSNLFLADAKVREEIRSVGLQPVMFEVSGKGLKDEDTLFLPRLPAFVSGGNPAAVVVALGANDAPDPANSSTFAARLDKLMPVFGDRPVIWLTHTTKRPEPAGSGAVAVNTAIRDAPSRWPNLHVLDFGATLDEHPAWIDTDHLHLKADGQTAFASAIVREVERVLKRS